MFAAVGDYSAVVEAGYIFGKLPRAERVLDAETDSIQEEHFAVA